MCKDVKIKTFKLEDLVGKQVAIQEYKSDDGAIVVAVDVESGELFVLGQEIIPEVAPMLSPNTINRR